MTAILALDASSDACSVALYREARLKHLFELAAKSHTQRLLPMVDELLAEAGCQLQDLDAIAYGRGPGSFTGVRIAMGVVQGLAFGTNLPVIPVSTLQAIAQGYAQAHPENRLPLLVAVDARMDEVYWGLFSSETPPQLFGAESVMRPEDLCKQTIIADLDRQFIALGSGWHYPGLQAIIPAQVVQAVHPSAQFIASLGLDEFQKGRSISIFEAEPVYLRDSVSWHKRQRIRTYSL